MPVPNYHAQSLQQLYEEGAILVSFAQVRKLRHRDDDCLAQGHTSREQQIQNSKATISHLDSLVTEPKELLERHLAHTRGRVICQEEGCHGEPGLRFRTGDLCPLLC